MREHAISVNIQERPEATTDADFARELERVLGCVPWLRGWRIDRAGSARDLGSDLVATMPLPNGGKAALHVECKREFRPSAFHALAARAAKAPSRHAVVVRVLALPWVSPRVAELCAEYEWSWFDLAGNHRLDVPGILRLEHQGNPPSHKPTRATANLSTREAARVVRALLNPNRKVVRWTQRDMQKECAPNVSLGLVNKVVRFLHDQAFVEPTEERGFRLRDPVRLLFAWRDAYRFDRHERRGYFSLLAPQRLSDALTRVGLNAGGFAAYAVFSAAERQAPHVRQPKTWIYLRAQDLHVLEKSAEAKPVDSGENIVVLIPDDDGVFYDGEGHVTGMSSTNPVQTYVDLYHAGSRGQEAAEALLDQRLKPAWGSMGFAV